LVAVVKANLAAKVGLVVNVVPADQNLKINKWNF
jgi:hypothetical protein